MRILHVMAGAATGGAETFAQDAITALAGRGMEQYVVCRPHPLALTSFAAAGVPVTPMSFAPLTRWTGARRQIRRIAEAFRAEIVHAWMARAASFVPGGWPVSWLDGAMPCPTVGWLGGYYDLKYYRSSDALIGVTPDIRRHLVAAGAPPHSTFVCHTFGTLPDAPPVARADLGTPDDALVVLVLSRMHEKKGIDTALRAMPHMPGAWLWLAGDGPRAEEYRQLAERLGVTDRVRFLGWRTDRKALLEAADVCLLPSRYEPFGTVIAEAWSARRPLVTTPADGARQFVRHEEDALVFPSDDAEALAGSVLRLASHPQLAARLVDCGYQKYEREFEREAVIDRLIGIYRDVAARGKAGSDLVDVEDLGSAARKLAARLDVSVRPEFRSRLAGAAITAMAYMALTEDGDVSAALDAGLLQLTGALSLLCGVWGARRVRLLRPPELDRACAGGDIEALRRANTGFLDALASQLTRPSW